MSLTNFCSYLLKYKHDFKNMSGSNLGAFKANHRNDFEELLTDNTSLDQTNFTTFFYTAFTKHKPDPTLATTNLVTFLTDAIQHKHTYCGTCIFSATELQVFEKYIEETKSPYNSVTDDSQNNQSVSPSMPLSQNHEAQFRSTLDALQQAMPSQSYREVCQRFQDTMNSLESMYELRFSEQLEKFLGVEKNLTSSEISDYLSKVEKTYDSILKKTNSVAILAKHIEKSTRPDQLNHQKFPKPYHVFANDHNYVQEYNEILEVAQTSMMELAIKHFNRHLECLQNDIKVFKNVLKHHIKDHDNRFQEIFNQRENNLKTLFNASMIKAEKVIAKKYAATTTYHQNHKKKVEAKTNKPTKENQQQKPKTKDTGKKQQHPKQHQQQHLKQHQPASSTFRPSNQHPGAQRHFTPVQGNSFNSHNFSNIYPNAQPQPHNNSFANANNSNNFFHQAWRNNIRN